MVCIWAFEYLTKPLLKHNVDPLAQSYSSFIWNIPAHYDMPRVPSMYLYLLENICIIG